MDLFKIHSMHYLDQDLAANQFFAHWGFFGHKGANCVFVCVCVCSTPLTVQLIFSEFIPNVHWVTV